MNKKLLLLVGAAALAVLVLGKKSAAPVSPAPAFTDPLMSSPYGNVANDDRPVYHVGKPSI